VGYKNENKNLFYLDQLKLLRSQLQIDKFSYFDSILATDFNLTCHYGSLEVILASLDIPVVENSQSNLYLIKLKEGMHQNQVLV